MRSCLVHHSIFTRSIPSLYQLNVNSIHTSPLYLPLYAHHCDNQKKMSLDIAECLQLGITGLNDLMTVETKGKRLDTWTSKKRTLKMRNVIKKTEIRVKKSQQNKRRFRSHWKKVPECFNKEVGRTWRELFEWNRGTKALLECVCVSTCTHMHPRWDRWWKLDAIQ